METLRVDLAVIGWGKAGKTLVFGEAAFDGPRRIVVRGGEDELAIEAEHVVINTGTTSRRAGLPGEDLPHVHDSASLQQLAAVPDRLVIVGAGPIGLEFADMYARFGSEVTVLSRGPVLPKLDEAVRASVLAALSGAGVRVVAGATVTEITPDAVLTQDGSYPAGDVNGGPQFTYVSMDDFRILRAQLLDGPAHSRADRVAVPRTTFLTPPLGEVGLTPAAAREAGHDILVATQAVADIAVMPRPKAVAEPHGVVQVVVDAATDELLGAAWHSVDAQEVINIVALAMRAGVTATQLRDGIWTHPSTTEALNGVLGELRAAE